MAKTRKPAQRKAMFARLYHAGKMWGRGKGKTERTPQAGTDKPGPARVSFAAVKRARETVNDIQNQIDALQRERKPLSDKGLRRNAKEKRQLNELSAAIDKLKMKRHAAENELQKIATAHHKQ